MTGPCLKSFAPLRRLGSSKFSRSKIFYTKERREYLRIEAARKKILDILIRCGPLTARQIHFYADKIYGCKTFNVRSISARLNEMYIIRKYKLWKWKVKNGTVWETLWGIIGED